MWIPACAGVTILLGIFTYSSWYNMETAAVGVTQISGSIDTIKTSADHATISTQDVLNAARLLATEAETLDKNIREFLAEVRAA